MPVPSLLSLSIVSVEVPFFGLTHSILRILNGSPKKELDWRLEVFNGLFRNLSCTQGINLLLRRAWNQVSERSHSHQHDWQMDRSSTLAKICGFQTYVG